MKHPRTDRLSVPEAAEELGVSASTAWRMVRRGEMRTVRIGRRRWVGREHIEDLLAPARRIGAVPFSSRHGIWRLVGRFRGRRQTGLGATDKHELLARIERS